MHNEFTAIVERDEDWFVAYCPEIPGANGQGKSKAEALKSLSEAIGLILADRREDAIRGIPADAERELVAVGRNTLLMRLLVPALLLACLPSFPATAAGLPAKGLIVHIAGNGEELAGLCADGRIVHGLYTNRADVAAARRRLVSLGINGPVSTDLFDGEHLPYADNLVNLIVVSGVGCRVSGEEIARVLVPRGVVMLPKRSKLLPTGLSLRDTRHATHDAEWRVFEKPVPREIDDWSHYLHGANGNPVADDSAVKPPRQLQWAAEPQWSRHHEHMAGMSALVSARGRVFSICDNGPKVSMLHPPDWRLTARDAFNGLLLWERPIADWFNHLQPLKSGPASLPRRLVASGDRVYATLGIDAPVSILDAGSGEVVQECKGTENTREIGLCNGALFLVRGTAADTTVTAVNADSGEVVWEARRPVVTFTLAANLRMLVFFDGQKVVALNPRDGTELWVSESIGEKRHANWLAKNPPRLILNDKAVVVAPGKKVYAVSADHGKILWSVAQPRSGYASPKDLFVIDDMVWYGDTAGADNTGRFVGRDVLTGEIKRSFVPDIDIIWLSHHRCHFSKATRDFIIPARMGVEFVDIRNEKWKQHHWVRGGCIYGVMPCNGLLYAPPHACACYFEAKQNGFSAYTSNTGPAAHIGERLEKGPAYASSPDTRHATPSKDWPVFRHDPARSGHADVVIPTNAVQSWSVEVGGELTQPVVADGSVYVASVNRHTLHALRADNGKPRWRFAAGGRIDSPPSIYRGLVLFGSRDGWVYCLRSRDGKLVWRHRAAPRELLVMSYGQLESAWPVHGSVLIENDELHCIAGRNMFLDGGLRYLRLDPTTGRRISETLMDENDPAKGGTIQKYDSWLDMTTTLPDVLASDGKSIYMRSLPFDMAGKRRRISHFPQETERAHLFSPTGFLDGNWFHRSYWTYARCFPGGWNGHLAAGRNNPSGRLLVVDDSTVYGFGRKPKYYRWTTSLEYRLFAADMSHKPKDTHAYDKFKARQARRFPRMELDRSLCPPIGPRALPKETYECKWENRNVPLLVRAMVSTKDCLWIAGPEDIADEGDHSFRNAKSVYEQVASDSRKQADIWKGKHGALLQAVSKADGSLLAEHKLKALPVFDGLIAANGCLFVSLERGELVCLR